MTIDDAVNDPAWPMTMVPAVSALTRLGESDKPGEVPPISTRTLDVPGASAMTLPALTLPPI